MQMAVRAEYAAMAEEHSGSPSDTERDGRIRLHVEGQVTLATLTRLVESWRDFLGEVGRGVTGRSAKDAVRYVITEASGGSFALCVRPEPARENVPAFAMPEIARTVATGIEELSQAAKRPRHFSDDALVKLRELARLVGPETPALSVSTARERPVALTSKLLAHVESVLSPEVRTIGTIEGELEGLIIHGTKRFLLYDRLTGRQDGLLLRQCDLVGATQGRLRQADGGHRRDPVAAVGISSLHPRVVVLRLPARGRAALRAGSSRTAQGRAIVDFRYWARTRSWGGSPRNPTRSTIVARSSRRPRREE